MKKRLIDLTFIVSFLMLIFGPYLSLNNESISVINLIFKPSSTLFLINIIVFILVHIFLFFIPFIKSIYRCSSIVSLFSLVINIFFPFIVSYYLEVDTFYLKEGYYLLILLLVSFCLFHIKDISPFVSFSIKDMTEIGIFIAMAIVLDSSFLKFKPVPNGGSVSFAMVPLFLLVMRKGALKGFISLSLVYATINCFRDGWGLYTFPFDYFFAFGSLALVGLFKKKIITKDYRITKASTVNLLLSIILALSLRIISHTISGMMFYGLSLFESFIYQLSYMLPSSIICLISMVVFYKPLLVLEKRFPSSKEEKKSDLKLI